MKMKVITVSALILLASVSCENKNGEQHNHNDHTEHHEHEHEDDSQEHKDEHEDQKTLSLNNGEKWKVNSEMTPHIEKSQEVLENFKGDNYMTLAEDMMEHTNKLIQSCTMDGASHDELHKWLHPHIELIKKLKTEKDQQKVKEIVDELKESFEVYHTYFK